ncbi:exo-beta-N-acetylmuramidase NamZ domain-containing protein [Metabacillus indicus]|uniref:exo-beta-N-acetylmuramidase NamZ family protein n=1 Tax=Metabacillus indicus TaxID=246786 RepID=UPI0039841732
MKRILVLITVLMLAISAWPADKDVSAHKEKKKNKVTPGVEVLLEDEKELLKGKKVGLITNPTGIDSNLNSIVDQLHNDPEIELTALFGPEHGVRGDAQAGSYVEFYIDEKTGLPVYSLYGNTKKPTPEMLENVEILLFDIQDVGTRYYTYIYTMAYAMEAAKENNIPIVVLDRPNPQGGDSVDGPVLEPEAASFIGLYPIPTKHGMTVGELASLFNEEFNIGADLTVVKMKGWKRSMGYDDTGLPFVLPSPNMPTVSTAFVYPATGLIEGTNLSEGRGTTKPFELIGAPFINSTDLAAELNALSLPGVKFRAASFTPMFSKHAGKLSHGVEVYVTDREEFDAVPTGLHIVKTVHDMYPEDFEFLSNNFFDKLIGNTWTRPMILEGAAVSDITDKYKKDLDAFKKVRKEYLIYK